MTAAWRDARRSSEDRSSRHDVAWLSVLKGGEAYRQSTRHGPAGPYAGVLATRCVAGAKPRGQCTEMGPSGDTRTHRRILLR